MKARARSAVSLLRVATAVTRYPAFARRAPTAPPTLPAPMMATVFMMYRKREARYVRSALSGSLHRHMLLLFFVSRPFHV
jgi:hypothetical protein